MRPGGIIQLPGIVLPPSKNFAEGFREKMHATSISTLNEER
jgi:hypothetical protein